MSSVMKSVATPAAVIEAESGREGDINPERE